MRAIVGDRHPGQALGFMARQVGIVFQDCRPLFGVVVGQGRQEDGLSLPQSFHQIGGRRGGRDQG